MEKRLTHMETLLLMLGRAEERHATRIEGTSLVGETKGLREARRCGYVQQKLSDSHRPTSGRYRLTQKGADLVSDICGLPPRDPLTRREHALALLELAASDRACHAHDRAFARLCDAVRLLAEGAQ